VKILERIFDERFLAHRQRSTSVAGMLSAAGAIVLFEYRYFVNHVANWDLAAIGVAFVVIKMSLMAWYAVRD
jgi:hypothetical protein